MANFYVALGMVAPLYNLAFVVVAIILFIVLFRTPSKKAFMQPWYFLFVCILLFVVEEVITVLRNAGFITFIPQYTNSFFELGIIILFIYLVLLQKEYIKVTSKSKSRR
jgi:hypothetical protein